MTGLNGHKPRSPAKTALARSQRNGNSAHESGIFIDLFAGCGGLSLGLEQAGFEPILFSELNKQAAETYLANREDLEVVPVSDIYELTNAKLDRLIKGWQRAGIGDVDLVCGGPPCQGFSGIGHRRTFKLNKKDIPSNHLFEEMIRVIKKVRPKIFLFENVRGLLNSRWTPSGSKGEIWRKVLNSFREIQGYEVRWDLVHSKNYGVPQNRPRVLLVGLRKDIYKEAVRRGALKESPEETRAVEAGFIPRGSGKAPSMPELLSDLEDEKFRKKFENPVYLKEPETTIQRALRKRRDGGGILKKGEPLTEHQYSQHSDYIRKKYDHMIRHDGEIPEKFRTKKFAQRVFPREWGPEGPNLTATSLPEDYVHYKEGRSPTVREWARLQTFPDWYVFKGPRTTGGRRRAGDPSKGIWDRDVPRYTQIGNAVPVFLAKAVGDHFSSILRCE